MYVESIENLLDFIYSTWEICPVSARSITETKGDLLEKEGLPPIGKLMKKDILEVMSYNYMSFSSRYQGHCEVQRSHETVSFFCLNNDT